MFLQNYQLSNQTHMDPKGIRHCSPIIWIRQVKLIGWGLGEKVLLLFKPLAFFALPLGVLCIQPMYFLVLFVRCFQYIFSCLPINKWHGQHVKFLHIFLYQGQDFMEKRLFSSHTMKGASHSTPRTPFYEFLPPEDKILQETISMLTKWSNSVIKSIHG